MTQRVFVRVVGFSDVERHALNTVFRLSEQRAVQYAPWKPEAPGPALMALVDGDAYEALMEFERPQGGEPRLIWVGPHAPQRAWRRFERPIAWPDVVRAMDEMVGPLTNVDVDLAFNDSVGDAVLDEEGPGELDLALPDEPAAGKRALIAGGSREGRLYLRARLSLAQLTQADEADSGARVLELMRAAAYDVVLVDLALPDVDPWAFARELSQRQPAIPHLILLKPSRTLGERVKARVGGLGTLLDNPPDPVRLQALLAGV